MLGPSGLASDIWQVSDTLNSTNAAMTVVSDPTQLSKADSSALAPTFVAEALVGAPSSCRPAATAPDSVESNKVEASSSISQKYPQQKQQ
ncbi:unnamed protein product, partial [Dibothriocephalus latus]